jgi:ribonuclease HI
MAAVADGLQYLIDNRKRYFILDCATDVEIVSDSQYVVKGMNEWMAKWKRNGWLSHSGEPVKNEALWRKLDRLRDQAEALGYRISFKHIRGHRGDPFNERVDVLAGEAARKHKPT